MEKRSGELGRGQVVLLSSGCKTISKECVLVRDMKKRVLQSGDVEVKCQFTSY
jgi:hypothetical protein